MLIEKSIECFLEQALPLTMPSIETHSMRCYHCNAPVQFPIIARERDIEAIQTLINYIVEYGNEVGSLDNVLASILLGLSNG